MEKLGFGMMRLPLLNEDDAASVDMEQVKEMVDAFLERGFTYFDTAYMYHDGTSEVVAREALVKRHPRERFTLTTKMPTMFLEKEGDMERIFAEQLEKCGVDYFDYYLLHNLGVSHYAIAQKFDGFGFIAKMKAEGKVKKTGFSFHDNAELLDEILSAHPEVDVVQLQINYLDWDSAGIQSRLCYETAWRHGKEIIVMEPVRGGALAKLPERAEQLFREHTPQNSPASWAVRFAAGHEGVFMVLSGMSDMDQLLDNTAYMKDFKPLSEEEQKIVARAVDEINASIAIPCTACGYCTGGCPKSIPIPKYFTLYNAEKQIYKKGFSLQRLYYGNYAKIYGAKASDCVNCGQCEEQCPQHIPVMEHLKEVAQYFEIEES